MCSSMLQVALKKHQRTPKKAPKMIPSGPVKNTDGAACAKLRMAVERAVVGRYMVGRSKFLIWTLALGPHIDPVYALVKAAAWAFCAARRKCYARAGHALPDLCCQAGLGRLHRVLGPRTSGSG